MKSLTLRKYYNPNQEPGVSLQFRATTPLETVLERAAKEIKATYRKPVVVNPFPGGGTYHVQFGKWLEKTHSYTLTDTYVAQVEG